MRAPPSRLTDQCSEEPSSATATPRPPSWTVVRSRASMLPEASPWLTRKDASRTPAAMLATIAMTRRAIGRRLAASTLSANPAGGSPAGHCSSGKEKKIFFSSRSSMGVLQCGAQRLFGARDARLHRAQLDAQRSGNLLVGKLVRLAEQERGAMVRRELGDSPLQGRAHRAGIGALGRRKLIVERLGGLPPKLVDAQPHRDGQKPRRQAGRPAAVVGGQGAEGAQEGLLRQVTQIRVREPEHSGK